MTAELKAANDEIEKLRVQMAGILTAAEGFRPNPPVRRGDYGWSPTYEVVFNLRRKYDELNKDKTIPETI